jgi:putative serine protease PepD
MAQDDIPVPESDRGTAGGMDPDPPTVELDRQNDTASAGSDAEHRTDTGEGSVRSEEAPMAPPQSSEASESAAAAPEAGASTPPIPPTPAPGPRGRGSGGRWGVAALAALIGAVVGAGAGVGTYAAVDHSEGSSAQPGSIATVAAQLEPSVVTIDVVGSAEEGTASGIVLRSDGYILTNDHVVTLDGSQSASAQITVVESNGNRLTGTVVGQDPVDDLAVVKVAASGLTPATFGDSSKLAVGQPVVAIGAPLGLSDTVTSGIVSAVNRPAQAGNDGEAIFDAVQTDAPINPGNSGGPLVNLSGQVVGVNSAIASTGSTSASGQPGSIGIGFAIPANEAQRIANQLISTGQATHAMLGVTVEESTGENLDSPTSGTGATVAAVTPGGPAAQAGIQPGDVITAVGPQPVGGRVALVAAVRSYAPGTLVPLQLIRGGTPMSVTVTLAPQPAI